MNAGSVHTFGVELNRETFEQYKQEIEFPVCADFMAGSGHEPGIYIMFCQSAIWRRRR